MHSENMQTVLGLPEILTGISLLALLVGMNMWMMRSCKPDSKMVLLLSLMKDLPKDGGDENAGGENSQELETEAGARGPSRFSLLALDGIYRNFSWAASSPTRCHGRTIPERFGSGEAGSR
jgi:hypothetical protein